jgi:hypothetical protein
MMDEYKEHVEWCFEVKTKILGKKSNPSSTLSTTNLFLSILELNLSLHGEVWSDHSPPASAEVKKMWIYTYTMA